MGLDGHVEVQGGLLAFWPFSLAFGWTLMVVALLYVAYCIYHSYVSSSGAAAANTTTGEKRAKNAASKSTGAALKKGGKQQIAGKRQSAAAGAGNKAKLTKNGLKLGRNIDDKTAQYTCPWLVNTLKGHTDEVLDMDFSANGKFLASTAKDLGYEDEDDDDEEGEVEEEEEDDDEDDDDDNCSFSTSTIESGEEDELPLVTCTIAKGSSISTTATPTSPSTSTTKLSRRQRKNRRSKTTTNTKTTTIQHSHQASNRKVMPEKRTSGAPSSNQSHDSSNSDSSSSCSSSGSNQSSNDRLRRRPPTRVTHRVVYEQYVVSPVDGKARRAMLMGGAWIPVPHPSQMQPPPPLTIHQSYSFLQQQPQPPITPYFGTCLPAMFYHHMQHDVLNYVDLTRYGYPVELNDTHVYYHSAAYGNQALNPTTNSQITPFYNPLTDRDCMQRMNMNMIMPHRPYTGFRVARALRPHTGNETCTRCGKSFYINNGRTSAQLCHYHWGKARTREVPVRDEKTGTTILRALTVYTCCGKQATEQDPTTQADGTSPRLRATYCDMNTYHVWSGHRNGRNVEPADCYVFTYRHYDLTRRSSVGDRPLDMANVYALDCEMLYTTAGMEVTRVTLLYSDKTVAYDTLVKPQHQVLDYNTRFSGVGAAQLERAGNAARTLQQVQADLMHFLRPDTILVGHGLENDLRALRLVHLCVVDTAICFADHSYRPSLRDLALKHLGMRIHVDNNDKSLVANSAQPVAAVALPSKEGHCSIQDASICLDLMSYRIQSNFQAGRRWDTNQLATKDNVPPHHPHYRRYAVL